MAAALTATALIGGSLAYFQADGQEVQQQMNTRTLSISLKDAGSGTLPEETVLFDDAMPGADLEMEHRLVVENTGDTPGLHTGNASESLGRVCGSFLYQGI